MAALPRWRGWLILVAALVLFSACTTMRAPHPISGATATTGPVTVTTNLSTYTTGDAVGVTITNTSKSNYYTQDGRSACSIVQLEEYDAGSGAWKPLDSCDGRQPTQTLIIPESASAPYTLAPNSPGDENAWQSGTYRVSVTYSTQADGITNPQEAHSAAFTIKG